jgi:hypothetical protein
MPVGGFYNTVTFRVHSTAKTNFHLEFIFPLFSPQHRQAVRITRKNKFISKSPSPSTVKPSEYPTLSQEDVAATGVTQADVNSKKAQPLDEVLRQFSSFLQAKNIVRRK